MSRTTTIYDRYSDNADECTAFDAALYAGDPYYRAPPPPPESSALFTVSGRGGISGHATVLVNEGIAVDGEPTALLGWYECVEDPAAAEALLGSVFGWCRDSGYRRLLGPMNHDTWHSYRWGLPTAEPPFFLDLHHKSWYPEQFETVGFGTIARYYSSRVAVAAGPNDRIDRFRERFHQRGIGVREIDMGRFAEELARIYAVSVVAFRDNMFYTPLDRQEMIDMYTPLGPLVDPDFVLIAETGDGEPLAFAFAVPDGCAPHGNSLVVKTAAAVPGPQSGGLGTLLVEILHKRARERGFSSVVHALMHEKNPSRNIFRDKGRIVREYRLYCSSL